jgi:integrase
VESARPAAQEITWAERYAGCSISTKSMWADDLWELDVPNVTQYHRSVTWSSRLSRHGTLSDVRHMQLKAVGKAILYEMLTGGFGERRPIKQSSVTTYAVHLIVMLRWMSARRIFAFSDLTLDDVVSYRRALEVKRKRGAPLSAVTPRAAGTLQLGLTPLRVLIASAARIPDQPKCDHRELLDILTVRWSAPRRNTDRIPDEIAGPLFERACHWVQSFGAELLAQYDAMDTGYQESRSPNSDHRSVAAHVARRAFGNARATFEIPAAHGPIDVTAVGGLTFRSLIRHLEAACFIVVAGMVGMRVSEIGSLQRGCLVTEVQDDGRPLLLLRAVLYKTRDETEGKPHEWVAGWDDGKNPVRGAVELLERLRAVDSPHTSHLFVSLKRRNTRTQDTMHRHVHQTRLNDFALFVGIRGWFFKPHQFRKTFARFVTKRDYTGLSAQQRHFAHVSIQMTELYGSWDDELVSEVLEAELEQDLEALDKILASERLAGALGLDVLGRNQRFRGLAGAAARAQYIAEVRADGSTDRLRLMRHDYGYCIMEADDAACGLEAWKIGPPTCAPCKNLILTDEHRPYWEGIASALRRDMAASEPFADAQRRDLQKALEQVEMLLDGLRA